MAGVHAACKEVFRSRKLKRLLELVLACGNYMNRGQRGHALGFRPASLNHMLDTRSSASKTVTLLHYVVDTLEKKVRHAGEKVMSFWRKRYLSHAAALRRRHAG